MLHLKRPEGAEPADLYLSRRSLAASVFGGYALAALSADAAPIRTDARGLLTGPMEFKSGDRNIPAFMARPEGDGRYPTVILVSEVFGVHE